VAHFPQSAYLSMMRLITIDDDAVLQEALEKDIIPHLQNVILWHVKKVFGCAFAK